LKTLIWLAGKSLRHNPWRNLLLMVCLSSVVFIPWVSSELLRRYDQDLKGRAADTPLVIGQKGHRFDLCLGVLFFRKAALPPLQWSHFVELTKRANVLPVPLHLGFTVQDLPLVCTTPEYFEQRELVCTSGHIPHTIRQVVLGSKAAAQLHVGVGDVLHSDPAAGFGLSGAPAQDLEVVGVLRTTHGPDDRALFASMQTAWLLNGALHGHTDARTLQDQQPNIILAARTGGLILSGAVVPDQDANSPNPVHLHKDASDLPISAILLWPHSQKERTLLQTEIETRNELAILRPTLVVQDLMHYTLRFKPLIDRLLWLLGLGMLALFALVVGLSSQMRSKEWTTLRRLGTPPHTIAGLLFFEIGLIALAALGLAAAGTWLTIRWLPDLVHTI
jgi:putative ABC transport system permease protein